MSKFPPPASRNSCNQRNQRNPKCSICGLDKINGKCPAEKKRGQYLIDKIDGVVYSTDNIFWRDFFKGG